MHVLLRDLTSSLGTGLVLAAVFNAPVAYLLWKSARLRRQFRDAQRDPLKDLAFRPPGESLRQKIESLLRTQQTELLAVLFAALIAVVVVTSGPSQWRLPLLGLATGVVLATAAWAGPKMLRTTRQLCECRLAFDGERLVGEELNQLRADGYQIVHDLPCERYNIDHVIAGPGGVFAVETKTHQRPTSGGGSVESRVRYDGETLSWPRHADSGPVDQALFNARSLGHWLSCATGSTVRVQPVVAVPGWSVEANSTNTDVWVLTPKDIRAAIGRCDRGTLSPDVLAQIGRLLATRGSAVHTA